MRHHSTHDPRPERFYVACPTCDEEAGSYSPMMKAGFHSCRCGTTFTIDVENECVGEVATE